MRAVIEVALLTHGIPYDALRADEQQVLRWFGAIQMLDDAQAGRIAEMVAMARGG